jgi:flagellar basal-body rod modification protein FlgD
MSTTLSGVAASAPATSSATTAASGTNALQSLSGNYQTFLNMLMTQLQNQDPSSPMDTDQFTTELVQFSGVEQQIQTNTSLSQLISLGQSSQMLQTSAILGHSVTATSSQLALQGGKAALNFTATTAAPVTIQVANANGQVVSQSTVAANAGSNAWSWNGQSASGTQLPDGAYGVTVTQAGSGGASTALPFTVTGTVTGAQSVSGTMQIDLGTLQLPMSSVTAVSG